MGKDAKSTRRYRRIDRSAVEKALKAQVVVAASHLDFEGVAYVKLTRTGPNECFAADVTSQVLGGGEVAGKYEAQKDLWKKPAMEKFGEAEK